jgi:hypothetical protein
MLIPINSLNDLIGDYRKSNTEDYVDAAWEFISLLSQRGNGPAFDPFDANNETYFIPKKETNDAIEDIKNNEIKSETKVNEMR